MTCFLLTEGTWMAWNDTFMETYEVPAGSTLSVWLLPTTVVKRL